MQAVFQRSRVPLTFIGALMIALLLSVPSLRSPMASGLLALTALLVLLRPVEREIRLSSQFRKRVLLLGNGPLTQKFIHEIESFPKRGFSIVGVVEESSSKFALRSPYLVLGTIDELQTIVREVKPDLIVLALSDRRGRLPVAELLEFQASGIVVEDIAEAYERVSGKLPIEVVTPGQLIASQRLRKSRALKTVQRALSFITALVLLVVLAPLFAIVALAIRLDSAGPILFRQRRLGKGSRPFDLIKFRTMKPIERAPSEWVQDNRTRITPVGQWLRRLRIDELPQLVNVICGDMNLVGPRPHPVTNLQLFRDSIPYYALRGSILPGITGWAQVRYHYANNLEEETEKMRYDLFYIKHMSVWLDLRIALSTCGVFLSSFTRRADRGTTVNTGKAIGPTRLEFRRKIEASSAFPVPPVKKANELRTDN